METWLTLAGMTAVTYATRALPFLGRWFTHPALARALRHVPPAIFAALITSSLLQTGRPGPAAPRLLAGTLGLVIAWRTRSLPITLVAGLGAFALRNWL